MAPREEENARCAIGRHEGERFYAEARESDEAVEVGGVHEDVHRTWSRN